MTAGQEYIAKVAKRGFEFIGVRNSQKQACFHSKATGLAVICEQEEHDGKLYGHISFSRKSRIPSYEDMVFIKEVFVGDDHKAIMVLPAASEHVNIDPYCLHFFVPLDHDPLSDFRKFGGI